MVAGVFPFLDEVSKAPAFGVIERRTYAGTAFVKITHKKFDKNLFTWVPEDMVDKKLVEKYLAEKAAESVTN